MTAAPPDVSPSRSNDLLKECGYFVSESQQEIRRFSMNGEKVSCKYSSLLQFVDTLIDETFKTKKQNTDFKKLNMFNKLKMFKQTADPPILLSDSHPQGLEQI